MKKNFTKWFSFAVLSVLAGLGVAFADEVVADPTAETSVEETLYVKDADGTYYIKEGETAQITVKLNQNGTKVYGLQASINVPEGFEAEVEGVDAQGITTVAKPTAKGVSVAIYSATPIDAKISDIFTLKVTPVDEEAEGDIEFSKFVISKDVEGTPTDYPLYNLGAIKVKAGIAPALNLDFEAGTPVAADVKTAAADADKANKDITDETKKLTSGAQEVKNWVIVANGDNRAAGLFAYASAAVLGGNYKYMDGNNEKEAAAKAPANGFGKIAGYDAQGADTKALGILACWSSSTQYTQTVLLPAGTHALLVPVYNAGGDAAVAKNQIGVIVGETETFAKTTTYKRGEWKLETIEFTLEEESEVTYSLGYTAPNVGSATMPHLFIGEVVELIGNEVGEEYYTYRLNLKKNETDDYLKNLPHPAAAGVLFGYPYDTVENARKAVKDAETFEEIDAILAEVNASQILPYDENTPYVIKHVASGRYMTLVDGAVVLAGNVKDEATSLYFEKTEGGYYVTDKDAKQQSYIGLQSNSTYKMQTEPALKAVITPVFVKMDVNELILALQEKNGQVGTDSNDEGSICYADKNAKDKDAAKAERAQWIIERATPVYTILDEEATLDNWTRAFTGDGINGSFVLNTWSTENDASSVRKPFIESWVKGDSGLKLSPETFTYKELTGLTKGEYTIELTVRAYNETAGSTTPEGVKLTANGKSVEISTGQAFTFNDMAGIWDNYQVVANVGEDGKLNIVLEVYESKLTWLAFKNLKVVMNEPPVLQLVPENLINDPTDELQKEAKAFYDYYTTPETYNDAAAAIANAQKVADFYEEYETTIDALDRAGKKVFNAAEKVETTAEGLKAALGEALLAQEKIADDTDLTPAIKNNGFEKGDLTGWTNSGAINAQAQDNKAFDNVQGNFYAEKWHVNGTVDLNQTIANQPAGTYQIAAYAYASDELADACIYANGVKTPVSTSQIYTVEVRLEEPGDLTFGASWTDNGSGWFCMDEFSLIYLGADVIPTAITKVDKVATQKSGKCLENGSVVIYKNGKKFNVAGQAIK